MLAGRGGAAVLEVILGLGTVGSSTGPSLAALPIINSASDTPPRVGAKCRRTRYLRVP